jgi:hypothetical protein
MPAKIGTLAMKERQEIAERAEMREWLTMAERESNVQVADTK